MKYIIRSAKTENTEAIKEYIESKLSKLDKYFETSDDIEATVLTKVNGREKVIEVTIPTKHFTLRNEEANEDLYAAIDKIADKLERQIRKNKTRMQRRVNKNELVGFDLSFDSAKDEEEEKTIVKRKEIEMKPMSEEEAILQMNLIGHEFFVFTNVETGNVDVLYQRKDGNYGIIETK